MMLYLLLVVFVFLLLVIEFFVLPGEAKIEPKSYPEDPVLCDKLLSFYDRLMRNQLRPGEEKVWFKYLDKAEKRCPLLAWAVKSRLGRV